MYIANQDGRSQASNQPTQPAFVDPSRQGMQNRIAKQKKFKKMNLNYLSVLLVVLVGILVALMVIAILFYKSNNEGSYVNTSTYQSVDINVAGQSGGQIYFGQIKSMNSSYIIMDNVFYLQPGSTSNQFTLNSLTCALYNPQNQIIIKTAQVAFWENLSTKSQIVTDINKWHTDNLQCAKTTPAATSSTTPTTSTTTGK
jgi:hypothetical protein